MSPANTRSAKRPLFDGTLPPTKRGGGGRKIEEVVSREEIEEEAVAEEEEIAMPKRVPVDNVEEQEEVEEIDLGRATLAELIDLVDEIIHSNQEVDVFGRVLDFSSYEVNADRLSPNTTNGPYLELYAKYKAFLERLDLIMGVSMSKAAKGKGLEYKIIGRMSALDGKFEKELNQRVKALALIESVVDDSVGVVRGGLESNAMFGRDGIVIGEGRIYLRKLDRMIVSLDAVSGSGSKDVKERRRAAIAEIQKEVDGMEAYLEALFVEQTLSQGVIARAYRYSNVRKIAALEREIVRTRGLFANA
jgi:hypothetical protein